MAQQISEEATLENFIKYCLGYISLINPAFSRYKVYTEPLDEDVLDPEFIYKASNGDNDILPIVLKEFYELTPKELTEENEDAYLKQKELAKKIEEIRNKFRVNEYTKQITLNFGYFKVEVKEDESLSDDEEDEEVKIPAKPTIQLYPLFSIPIEIFLKSNKYYYIRLLDSNVIPNLGFLQNVLDEQRYYEFLELISSMEINEELSLPLKHETIDKIWDVLKRNLKLSDAIFDEDSFSIQRYVIFLSAKSNYFLAQDLKNLKEKPAEDLLETSLSSWVSDEDMSIDEAFDEENGELFFPFEYDKSQLRILSIINNKASIVEGPPGTGKSQTIANLLCHLAATQNRVLFISQKDQALKVVKDKLKELNIDYLFGYVPNRHSPLYSKEEEADGAAYALAGIQHFITSGSGRGKSADLSNIKTRQVQDLLNNSIEQQRTFHFLFNQSIKLEEYDIRPKSAENFLARFTEDEYQELRELETQIDRLESQNGQYVVTNNCVSRYDVVFNSLPIAGKGYSACLGNLLKIVENNRYDRKNKLGRTVNMPLLKMKLRKNTGQLPREIFDEFEGIVYSDKTNNETVHSLTALQGYFVYKENIEAIKDLTAQKELELTELGLDEVSYKKLVNLTANNDLNEVIQNVKEKIKVDKQLRELRVTNPNEVNKLLHKIKFDRKERVKQYIRNRIKSQVQDVTATRTAKGTIARVANALKKSKKAYKTFDQLKSDPENFFIMKEAVPVWIMDLEDVSRIIPLEKNLFDYVILDEASQCNIAYAFPAMYRTKHVIFFGDSEQMRDDSIKFKTNQSLQELAKKFSIPAHWQIKSEGDAVKSVLDIGLLCGFKTRYLQYHYRSPKELIGFSNESFYTPKGKRMEVINSNYLTYKDTNKVLVNHVIEAKKEEDISDKTNIAEAQHIADLVKELQADEKNNGKSIGILTFFREQAYLLRELIDDESIKVSIIEGVQGDERDIIIFSFVIASPDQKKRYLPLTGEGGDIAKGLNEGRVNVAFSRARQQVHCVTSLPVEEWPDGIWIKRYLKYVRENGKISFYDQDLKPFDSYFEEEFYYFLRSNLSKDYILQNQVKSCGFKIDFVVTDIRTNKKLAIECDGPTHFEDEVSETYVESDI